MRMSNHLKKVATILLFVWAMTVQAQNIEQETMRQEAEQTSLRRVYAELVADQQVFSNKIKVDIDFGQATSWPSSGDQTKLVDSNGKDIKFNSIIEAMNYMSERGWQFVQAYVVPNGGGKGSSVSGCVHWILYKDVTTDYQVTEGLLTRQQIRH